MKKVIFITILMSVLLINAAVATPFGFIFTDVKEPVAASSLKSYSKTASGTNIAILSLVGFGDASTEKIAKEAGIKQIKHVDKHTFAILGVYVAETFTVYGD
jgi:hypothetical protein